MNVFVKDDKAGNRKGERYQVLGKGKGERGKGKEDRGKRKEERG